MAEFSKLKDKDGDIDCYGDIEKDDNGEEGEGKVHTHYRLLSVSFYETQP